MTEVFNPPLYALADEYRQVLALFDDENAEPAAIEAALDAIAGQINHKADAIAALVRQFTLLSEARAAEATRMTRLAQLDASRADRLKNYLLNNMLVVGAEKIDTPRFHITVRTNPPAVEVLDQTVIPDQFIREVIATSVDKRAILEHYKATGELVDGTDIRRGQRLDIR